MNLNLNPEKIKPLSFLLNKFYEREPQFYTPKFSFFLGSGCSVNSGIPTAAGIKEICQKKAFINEHPEGYKITKNIYPFFENELKDINDFANAYQNDFTQYLQLKERIFEQQINKEEMFSKIPETLKKRIKKEKCIEDKDLSDYLYKEFKIEFHKDSLYGKWFQEFSQDSRGRQSLIENIIENKIPSAEYVLLASLIKQNQIHNIFTTNFDDLINEALFSYFGAKAKVYSHNEIAKYISIGSKKANIIKLHGDYLYENIKNLEDETSELLPNMKRKFQEALNYLDLIIVGYSGADHSIMSALEEIKQTRTFTLLWCGRSSSNLHWRVVNLINETKNSYFIEIGNFESLILKLWNNSSKEVPDILASAKIKQEQVTNLFAKFNESIDTNINTKEEKVEFNSKLFEVAYREKDPKVKVELYLKLLKTDPNNPSALNNLALTYFNTDKNEKAIQYFSKAIELFPNFGTAYQNRAIAYNRIGKYMEALDDIEKAIMIIPNDGVLYSLKGIILYKMDKKEQSLSLLNKAIEISPQSGASYVNRSLFYLDEGRLEEAEKDLNIAETYEIGNPEVLFINRAVIARKRKNFPAALQLLDEAAKICPHHSNIEGTKALIYADQGDRQNFYTYIEIALKKGCPVSTYLTDPGFEKYIKEQKFLNLLRRYKQLN